MEISRQMPQAKSIKVRIQNKAGLHARPAAMFVAIASNYKNCEITVHNGKKWANGKSIMGMLLLEAREGTELLIKATGQNSDKVLTELEQLILSGFNEE